MTDTEARDDILSTLSAAWDADGDSWAVPLGFMDAVPSRPEDGSAWALASVSKAASFQATLSSETGQMRHRTVGTVMVQIRTPQGDGYTLSDKLSRVARDAFRGKRTAGGVVFSRSRVREGGIDGTYTLVNVLADFEYDEIA